MICLFFLYLPVSVCVCGSVFQTFQNYYDIQRLVPSTYTVRSTALRNAKSFTQKLAAPNAKTVLQRKKTWTFSFIPYQLFRSGILQE